MTAGAGASGRREGAGVAGATGGEPTEGGAAIGDEGGAVGGFEPLLIRSGTTIASTATTTPAMETTTAGFL